MARAKTKAPNLRVPQNDAEAEQMIAQLGASQRDQAETKARHDAVIAGLEESYGKAVKAFQEAQAGLIEGISVWAAANRERLTAGGKTKTVQLASGTILWRDGRYAVKHPQLRVDDVILAVHDRIKQINDQIADSGTKLRTKVTAPLWEELETLNGFLRGKITLNKDAMLAAREIAERVPGVSIPRGPEEFAVEPIASQIRDVA